MSLSGFDAVKATLATCLTLALILPPESHTSPSWLRTASTRRILFRMFGLGSLERIDWYCKMLVMVEDAMQLIVSGDCLIIGIGSAHKFTIASTASMVIFVWIHSTAASCFCKLSWVWIGGINGSSFLYSSCIRYRREIGQWISMSKLRWVSCVETRPKKYDIGIASENVSIPL